MSHDTTVVTRGSNRSVGFLCYFLEAENDWIQFIRSECVSEMMMSALLLVSSTHVLTSHKLLRYRYGDEGDIRDASFVCVATAVRWVTRCNSTLGWESASSVKVHSGFREQSKVDCPSLAILVLPTLSSRWDRFLGRYYCSSTSTILTNDNTGLSSDL